MRINTIAPAEGAKRATKRVGRGIGSGTGKTSTKGHKGQWARSGGGVRPGFEGGQMPLTRRQPKRGFNNARFAKNFSTVNRDALNKRFNDGDVVNAEALVACGLISSLGDDGVKVLGNGTITKKLTVSAAQFTASAKEKIEAAGGKCEVV